MTMTRVAFFVYGLTCHALFLAVYAYMAGFVGNMFVPRSIDGEQTMPMAGAAAINIGLLVLFGLQHSVMARPAFKAVWTRWIPKPIERSTYVLASCIAVGLLMWLWQPIDLVIWEVGEGPARTILLGMFALGWLAVPLVTFLINHFDLFGVRQVWLHLRGVEYTSLPLRTPGVYRWVRHPLYVGWALAFWATPTMTVGHLLFAGVLTLYMVVAARIEERDLVAHFGPAYEEYRKRVPMFVPMPGRGVRDERDLATV